MNQRQVLEEGSSKVPLRTPPEISHGGVDHVRNDILKSSKLVLMR